jgi:hypothetical protein
MKKKGIERKIPYTSLVEKVATTPKAKTKVKLKCLRRQRFLLTLHGFG